MGISRLNSFLRRRCNKNLTTVHLREFRGKTLVIDTSIYLYKFKADGCIITNMYYMCILLKYYGITPIFVFDGKPPPEKRATIEKRKTKKAEAETEYNTLKKKLEGVYDTRLKKIIESKIIKLQRDFIRIKNREIREVKKLFQSCGISYIEADGEADKWCAKLVLSGRAYACISEDMDMFAYGCPFVLRYVSLCKHNAILYDLEGILTNLGITFSEFQTLCILAGSDYSSQVFTKTMNYYYTRLMKFKKLESKISFNKWLCENKISPMSDTQLQKTANMFNIQDLPFAENMIIANKNDTSLRNDILQKYNFIFPPSV